MTFQKILLWKGSHERLHVTLLGEICRSIQCISWEDSKSLLPCNPPKFPSFERVDLFGELPDLVLVFEGISVVTRCFGSHLVKVAGICVPRYSFVGDLGVVIENLVQKRIDSTPKGLGVLESAQKLRYQNPNLRRKISTGMKLEILQNKQIYSSFLLLESSALNCLAQDRDIVNLREGYEAFKGIYALQDVVNNYDEEVLFFPLCRGNAANIG